MIFTVGRASSYDRSFEEGKLNFKIGRTHHDLNDPDYPGGTVWQFRDAAELWVMDNDGYRVYGVMASWITDTAESDNSIGGSRDLLFSSLLVRLKKEE